MCVACAWRVHIPMLALSSNQGLCGGINTRVSKEVKLALDASPADNKPKVRAPRGGLANTHPRPHLHLRPPPPPPTPPPPPPAYPSLTIPISPLLCPALAFIPYS